MQITVSEQMDVIALLDTGVTHFKLHYMIGSHEVCGGKVYLQPSSKTNNVLICKACQLRVSLPVEVDTFQKCNEHFSQS